MPRVQRLDGSSSDPWPMAQEAVCEPAPVQYARNPNKDWPFLFSYENGRCLINKATHKSKYQEACAAGVALF